MKKWVLAGAVFGALTCAPHLVCALPSFKVQDIQVEGLKRISEGTIYSYLPIKIGETLSEEDASHLIHALFKTGFFEDVKLLRKNNVLVIQVKERPSIGGIEITGNDKIKTKDLLKGLKEAGLYEGGTFNPSLFEKIKQELERQYYALGRYAVEIKTSTTPMERNRVALAIEIDEGDVAKIRQIRIIGNEAYTEKTLRSQFALTTPGLFTWFTDTDQYSKQKLSSDLEALRSYYMDRGYLQFQIDSTQVSLTPDKKNVFITINISEGERYTFDSYTIHGEIPVSKTELEALVKFHTGETFSRRLVTDTTQAMTDLLGQQGYAFANVNPIPDTDAAKKTVKMTFFIDPGKRVYVRRIEFKGNTKTYDEVLRREMTQMESGWFSSKKVDDSKTRLNRSGYFKDVNLETKPVAGVNDQVDLHYTVEEASLGAIEGGIGYSDAEGFLVNASISNHNFLGTGNSLDVKFNNSKATTVYNIGYNNPYYTIDGISRGFNLFYSATDLGRTSQIANYSTDVTGANMTFGMPLTELSRLDYGFGVQHTTLSIAPGSPIEINQFIDHYGTRYGELNLNASWTRNALDRAIFPEKGTYHQASLMSTIPGSHLEYYRVRWQSRAYQPIGAGFIAAGRFNTGYGNGYGKTSALPFYQHYFLGGTRSVRGFEENALGPRDSTGRPFGGDFMVSGSAAMILPNFFSPENKSVRFSLFVDGGQVYDLKQDQWGYKQGGPRFSTGVTLTWMSPIAPLEFILAKPINRTDGDKTQTFAFNFGTAF